MRLADFGTARKEEMKEEDWKDTERDDGHRWGIYREDAYESCRECMMIRRRDRMNKPCRGKAKLRPMEPPLGHFGTTINGVEI